MQKNKRGTAPVLTAENYFSLESQTYYMSASQFKSFMKCEAATIAELHGEYTRPQSTALLVGSYVDAYFEGKAEAFQAQHPEMFTKKGELKAEFRHAQDVIARIERDPLFMQMLSGEKQVIRTGTLGGVLFKIKMDSYFPDRLIVDLKVMRDFQPIWSEAKQQRVHFIEAWGYDLQGAVYQAIEGHELPFFIAAATKETEPDIAVLSVPQYVLDAQRYIVEMLAKRFDDLKHGIGTPARCEHCDYCKRTKQLTEIIDYTTVLGGTYTC